MHIWTELATSQVAFLALLAMMGAGPAALLSSRFDATARLALAPVLGFCVGTCVFTTLLQFFPANDTNWLLIPLALGSAGVALWQFRKDDERRLPTVTDLAQLALVCLAVTVPLNAVLHSHSTVGPASYYFTDTDNYVGVQDGMMHVSLHDARELAQNGGPFPNLSERMYAFIAEFSGSNLDAAPLKANVTGLLGLGGSDTYSGFLIVLMLMGGLGVFAAVRRIAGEATWYASVAGSAFGGALFLELWFDGFQAALVAIGLLVPAVLMGWEALTERRPRQLALVSLMFATYLTVYPLYLAPLMLTGAVVLGKQLLDERRAQRSPWVAARALIPGILAVAAMTIAFDAVGFFRTLRYVEALKDGKVPLPRPLLNFPVESIPGWLFQTREFWYLPELDSSVKQFLLAVVLPIVFAGCVAVAVRVHRIALALFGLGLVFALVALYAYASQDRCTYCGERYLLALAPLLIVLLGVGLHAIGARTQRVWQVAAAVVALVFVAAGAHRARWEVDRFDKASYYLDSANRSTIDDIPGDGRPVQLEGYWASTSAQAEQPLVYHLLQEREPGRASIILGTNYANAVQYLSLDQVILPPGPEFQPGFRYVLTRFPGVKTDRRLIVRRGAFGLMERTRPFDIIPYKGLGIALARLDSGGVPWVQDDGALGFTVVGRTRAKRIYAQLTFRIAQPVTPPAGPGLRSRQAGGLLRVCVPAIGTGDVRDVQVAAPPPAPHATTLVGMRVVTGRCRVR